MRWKGKFALGLAAALTSAAAAKAQSIPVEPPNAPPLPAERQDVRPVSARTIAVLGQATISQGAVQPETVDPTVPGTSYAVMARPEKSEPESYGPTPLSKVNILNGLIWGEDNEKPPVSASGWMEFDYTMRSGGHGRNDVAPVMNRFGNEFLVRQLGLYLTKPLNPDEVSWGFNVIFLAGADASFLGPTSGGWANTNPRFGSQFTDLNLTAHIPFLTEGGMDIKAGRQTTILGPVGALAWQRPFTSSDYAWYNVQEGRYTGVSTVWHINKQLNWYNGIEVGGWGVFYDFNGGTENINYITNISYWLDEDAKQTNIWTTVLTGPASFTGSGLNTTVVELGFKHNWSERLWQIVDLQMCWSRAPIFGPVPPGYNQAAYDIYTYIGYHLTPQWDINTRLEWYYDQDGGGYPGGFGVPHTSYFAVTVGPDFHPTNYLQIRPEIRYDHATNPNFGRLNSLQNQLSVALAAVVKF